MFTSLERRFCLTQEDVRLLRSMGVQDPFTDDIPDSVFDQLDAYIRNADSEIGRAELEDLYETLVMSGNGLA